MMMCWPVCDLRGVPCGEQLMKKQSKYYYEGLGARIEYGKAKVRSRYYRHDQSLKISLSHCPALRLRSWQPDDTACIEPARIRLDPFFRACKNSLPPSQPFTNVFWPSTGSCASSIGVGVCSVYAKRSIHY